MRELTDLIPIPRVWERMDAVEGRLIEASAAGDEYLTKIAQHLLLAGGKRFRPLLCLLAAEFGPNQDHRPIEAAVSVELIHVGSLYHDDVIDDADLRRGAASVNAAWDNTVAILAGDFLMARASEVAATHLSLESVRLLAQTYAELVEGQTRELQLNNDLSHGISKYEAVIGGKTASLIRTSARLGALATDLDRVEVEALSTWAWEVGMVFQIADDALDLVATEEQLGKPAGSDLREGKFTLPILLALRGPEGGHLRTLLTRSDDTAVEEAVHLVRAGGYVDQSLTLAFERVARARAAAAILRSNPAHEVLDELGSYLVERVETVRS